ncbi:hypothetical protein E2P81_ATG04938 [Venturia nashicola]|nr:hypothetical protein E2P81_ATG04938 [Venturia nashicola]
MRRLMVDLMVWEFDDNTRDQQFSLYNVHFQKDVWKQLDPKAQSWPANPILPGTRFLLRKPVARHQQLHFEDMVTYITGQEEQQFYVHPSILRANSKIFKPPISLDATKVPNGDPDIFQAFLE